MNIEELKNLRSYSERFWSKLPKGIKPEIIIENNISGCYESETTKLGSRCKVFKPFTDQKIWSSWRVGFPMRWKGKTVICWLSGYHCEAGDPIMWITDDIWNVVTNKPLRKDASINCWMDIKKAASMVKMDLSDIRFIKDIDVDDSFKKIGWTINHKGIDWMIQQCDERIDSRSYWIKHSESGLYAKLAPSLKMAKSFIKYDSGLWLSDRSYILNSNQ